MNKTKKESVFSRVWPYFKKYKWIMVLDLFCAALTTVCELVLPLIVRFITSTGMTNLQSLTVQIIVRVALLYIALRIMDAVAQYYMGSIGHVMGAKIETDMRRDLFGKMQRLSYSYYDDTKIGQLMARISSDLFDITEFAHHCPEEFFIAGLKIVISFVILSSINFFLTLIIFSALPLMLLLAIYFNRKAQKAMMHSRHQVGEINSQVEDSLLGIRVVKSFANEEIEIEKFEQGNQKFLQIKKVMYHFLAMMHSSTRLLDGIMYVGVLLAGSLFMLDGKVTPADLMAYLLYISTLLTSVRRIVEFTEQFQKGVTGIRRFTEIMDVPVEMQDTPNSKELTNVKGSIQFEDVTFQYADNKQHVLDHINIQVKAGENVAIVGPSGSGKTTLCNLIPRFYDATGGRVLIDGQDVKNLKLHSLRSQIGMVQQDVYLFSGSVFENIVYGKPGATRQEVIEAAKQAGAHEFIMELPNGYDTFVGERGTKLSGGQKQRISIARVFLKNPPILILDEATSALDNESELIVQQSLEKLSKGRTTFTIAHRLTTIRSADTILVLTENGIEEQGSHQELMEKQGTYYKLYHMYTTV